MPFIILLLLTMVNLFSWGQTSCPTVRLDKDPVISSIPIWEQYGSPFCSPYSASFLAEVWIRKNWSSINPEWSSFEIDPYEDYYEMEDTKEIDSIMDANNGRICMSLNWSIKKYSSKMDKSKLETVKAPICDMYGFVKNEKNQKLRDPSEFKAKMHELIEKKSAYPFGVEYCLMTVVAPGDFIVNRTFENSLTYLNTDQKIKNLSSECHFHSSIIVGQEFRDGSCKFIIRNSFGESFGENGYNWVDEDLLSRNILRVISLE